MELSPTLLDIPVDLQLQITDELDPLDLLNLGLTCRPIYGVVFQRQVWESKVKRTCAIYGIFEGTYQMESMTINDLKHAAVGPWLLYKRISRHARTKRALPVRRSFELRWEGHDALSRQTLDLVPGGRYLIVTGWQVQLEGDAAVSKIQIWDLGLPSPCPPSPTLPSPSPPSPSPPSPNTVANSMEGTSLAKCHGDKSPRKWQFWRSGRSGTTKKGKSHGDGTSGSLVSDSAPVSQSPVSQSRSPLGSLRSARDSTLSDATRPRLVHTVSHRRPRGALVESFVFAPGSNRLRILVRSNERTGNGTTLDVLELTMGSSPGVTCPAKWLHGVEFAGISITAAQLHGDWLCVQLPTCIIVWDFTLGHYAAWGIASDAATGHLEFVIRDDVLISSTRSGIYAWKVPTLTPFWGGLVTVQRLAEVAAFLEPCIALEFPYLPSMQVDQVWTVTNPALQQSNQWMPTFIVGCRDHDWVTFGLAVYKTTYRHYYLSIPTKFEDAKLSLTSDFIPQSGTSRTVNYSSVMSTVAEGLPRRITYWCDYRGVTALAMEATGIAQWRTLTLSGADMGSRNVTNLCPASGRVAQIRERGGDNAADCIHILQF